MVTTKEVRLHSSRESCWVIVSGQAYDVTNFLDQHPGGANTILRFAGKVHHQDSPIDTEDWLTKL